MTHSHLLNDIKCITQSNQFEEINIRNSVIKDDEEEKTLVDKNVNKINDSENDNFNNSKNSQNFTNKKRGRKKLKSLICYEEEGIHGKFSADNIKRKIKTHYHNYIIALLNLKAKKLLDNRYKFGKIASDITQNLTVEFNQKLFEEKIKDIIVKISEKYYDKDKNKDTLELILKKSPKNSEILELLNMKYKDLFLNYYLKSTKKTFEGEPQDESYETHIKKLEKKFGIKYVNLYKKNAESLISFFYKCKKRKPKKNLNKLIVPKFVNNGEQGGNNKLSNDSNYLYNDIQNINSIESKKAMISTYTQTEVNISEDEEEF